jgi:hypothetical protein
MPSRATPRSRDQGDRLAHDTERAQDAVGADQRDLDPLTGLELDNERHDRNVREHDVGDGLPQFDQCQVLCEVDRFQKRLECLEVLFAQGAEKSIFLATG